MKRILTIAGSDSGGGAGIQADLKTITVLGGFGLSVITALTAQNTREVQAVQGVSPGFVAQQLEAVLCDIGADAAKTGMLLNAEVIEVVSDRLSAHNIKTLVVDPVMVAKSGQALLKKEAVDTLVKRLFPLALVVTPNIPEAEALTRCTIHSNNDLHDAARAIHALGPQYVLVKGGHLKGPAKDTLYDGTRFFELVKERIDTPHTHGTGCVFSAALSTFLAQGMEMVEAVTKAKDFVHTAICHACPLGKGHGPTNVYARFSREQERFQVLESLKAALNRLEQASVGHLVPEVQSNLGYGLPYAQTHAHVAAFPGRLVRLGDKIVSVAGPAFGASHHIASIILTLMRHHPAFRSVMNIRFSEDRIQRGVALGWTVCSFDRSQEPKDVKEREGSSLEWGTQSVLSDSAAVPDVIFDRGDIGKEPMIRILGKTPDEVVDKVLQLA